MRVNRYNLDVVFRILSPEIIANSIYSERYDKSTKRGLKSYKHMACHDSISKNLFINLANQCDTGFSKDEREEQFKLLEATMSDGFMPDASVFNLLYDFASEVLSTDRHIPICKYDSILKWQDTTHKLGQDIFTTIFLAKRDIDNNTATEDFSWDPIVRNDNTRLNKLIENGLAENHYHLNGSSQSFPINWVLLMNNPFAINNFEKFGDNLNPNIVFSTDYNIKSWELRIVWAAYIRLYLFQKMNMPTSSVKDEYKKYDKAINLDDEDTLLTLLSTDDERWANVVCVELAKKINTYRYMFGYKADCDRVILDYAIKKTMNPSNFFHNRILVGERSFMYDCFRHIKQNAFTEFDKNIFYLYLIIKSNFRSEFIQVNDEVGFRNFEQYQDRKEYFYDTSRYEDYSNEAYRISLNTTLKKQPVKSLEARITPKSPAHMMVKKVQDIDNVFEEYEDFLITGHTIYSFLKKHNKVERDPKDYFFVIHYPKTKYKKSKKNIPYYCRNYDDRQRNKRHTNSLIQALGTNKYMRSAVLGVDACANEIGCRPETFSVDFRCLRVVIPQSKKSIFGTGEKPSQLKFTYHVGEDFMNLTDGLRAIDEAIRFLGLTQGDRLGHALALGIDVDQYYDSKKQRIIMTKQDALDDDVWLMFRANELGITIEPELANRLQYQIHERINYIYGNLLKKNPAIDLSPHNYYCSWKLRGDAPELYKKGFFEDKSHILKHSRYEECMVNSLLDEKFIRDNKSAAYIYQAYHYDDEVKDRGFEVEVISIDEKYIELVKQVQKKMQFLVASKGIMIECNPSSNYLISTFDRYDMHPITTFNNLHLEIREDEKKKSAQLSVSINTDDLGVFDTSLPNEYAVMASALENKKDEKGDKLYSATQVYDYLESVRKMGFEQSFSK